MKPSIDFKSEGIHYQYKVRANINKVIGNSGIGKTYFIESLKADIKAASTGLKKYPIIDLETKESIPALILNGIDDDNIFDKIKKHRGIVIIDEADRLLYRNKEMCEFINNDLNNCYVIVARSHLPYMEINIKNFATVRTFENEIKIQYKILGKWV